jgi:hypothetical protein
VAGVKEEELAMGIESEACEMAGWWVEMFRIGGDVLR